MQLQPADEISAEPGGIPPRLARVLAVVLLLAALTVASVAALHYRGEAATRRQLRSVTGSVATRPAVLSLSSSTAALPSLRPLAGEVTAFAVRSSSGLARIIVTAQITGGQPYSRYELLGGDCAGNVPTMPGLRASPALTGRLS